jgi:biopolymer transport protein ExbD
MARKKRVRRPVEAGELNLTAMIDVAFQLLNFFVITSHPMDVLTHLDVLAPSGQQEKSPQPPAVLRVQIFADGYSMNDVPMSWAQMEANVEKFANIDPNQTVLIMSSDGAPHERMIRLLDLCTKNKMKNLAVVSTK